MENYEVNCKYCPNFKGFSGGMYDKINEDDFSDFLMVNMKQKYFLII